MQELIGQRVVITARINELEGDVICLSDLRHEATQLAIHRRFKQGKTFAGLASGQRIQFVARVILNDAGEPQFDRPTGVKAIEWPQTYNPQTDAMNPRQMYKQLMWWARGKFAARGKKDCFKHHLIPISQVRRSRIADFPENLIKCDFKTHYFFHRFLWRWKQTDGMFAAVRTFVWDASKGMDNGNGDYFKKHITNQAGIFPKQLKAILKEQSDGKSITALKEPMLHNPSFDPLFGFMFTNGAILKYCQGQEETDHIKWLEQQSKMLNPNNQKIAGIDLASLKVILNEQATNELERMKTLLSRIFINMFFYKYGALDWTPEDYAETLRLRGKLLNQLRVNISICLDFDVFSRTVYNKTRVKFLDNSPTDMTAIPSQLPFSIQEIFFEALPEAAMAD